MTEQQKEDPGIEVRIANIPANQPKEELQPDRQEMIDRLRRQHAQRQARQAQPDDPGEPAPRHRMPMQQPRAVQVDVPREARQQPPDDERAVERPPREWRRGGQEQNGEAMRKMGGRGDGHMPLPPRLIDDGPRQVRGFIGADKVWENNGKFLTIPGFVFFGIDFISTTMSAAYVVYLRNGNLTPAWWIVCGAIAFYLIVIQVTQGPAVWFSLRHYGEIHTKMVYNRRAKKDTPVEYIVNYDWVAIGLYATHAAVDMVITFIFLWNQVLPILVAFNEGAGPSGGVRAIGVASCTFFALLASIIPVAILIRNDPKQARADGGARME